jgi:hypothetical protein
MAAHNQDTAEAITKCSRRPVLRDTQDERGGVIQHEHLETGIPDARECGDARGVAWMLTVAAARGVNDAGWSW